MSNDLNPERLYRLVGFIAPVRPPTFVIPAFDLFDPDQPTRRGELSRSSLWVQNVCDGTKTTFVECEVDERTLIYTHNLRVSPLRNADRWLFGFPFPSNRLPNGQRLYAYAMTETDIAVGRSSELSEVLRPFLSSNREVIPRFRRLELARFLQDSEEIDRSIVDCANAISETNSEMASLYQELARIPIRRGERQ